MAKAWNRPPLTVIAGRPDVWRQDDSLLAAAHARYLVERVGPSGYPLRDAADPEKRFGWEVDASTVDYAQTAFDEWVEKRRDEDKQAVVPRLKYGVLKRVKRPKRKRTE